MPKYAMLRERLERELPGEGQLPLLGVEVVPFDRHSYNDNEKRRTRYCGALM